MQCVEKPTYAQRKVKLKHNVLYWIFIQPIWFIDYLNVSLLCTQYLACFNETNTDRDCGETCIEIKDEENNGNGDNNNGNDDEENCVKNECGRCGIKDVIV